MSTFGEDLIQSLNEALAHAQGEGPAVVHAPVDPREVRTRRADLLAEQAMPERLRPGCRRRGGK